MNSSTHTHHAQNAIWTIKVGDKVTGTYYGVKVSGTVVRERGHSIRWEMQEVTVELDSLTEIMGIAREFVTIAACGACGESLSGMADNSVHHA